MAQEVVPATHQSTTALQTRDAAARPSHGDGPAIRIVTTNLKAGTSQRQAVLLANGLAEHGERVSVRAVRGLGPLRNELDSEVDLKRRPWWLVRPGLRRSLLITGTSAPELSYGRLWRLLNPLGKWVVSDNSPSTDAVDAKLTKAADAVAYLSPAQRARQQLDDGRWLTVRHGLAPTPPSAAAERAHTDPDSSTTRLVYIGALNHHNGARTLLAAVGSGMDDMDWRLEIWGDGPDRHEVAEAVPHKLDGRITLCGACPDPAAVLAGAGLLLVPSRNEADPVVALEAMAAGVPLVVAAEAAGPEISPDNSAILVAPSDPENWRATLRAAIRDYTLRGRLAYSGRTVVREDFTPNAMVEDYLSVRRELLG